MAQRRPETLAVQCSVRPDGWTAMFGLRLDELSVDFSPGSKVHVAGIRYKPEPAFLSSAPVDGIEPDFHHADCFSAVVFEPLEKEPEPGKGEIPLGSGVL